MTKETIFALAVSLLTWGGVWAYLLRLDMMTRTLERQARDLDARDLDSREARGWDESREAGASLREEAGL